ncbi:hypothetical protein GALL_36470 [mine drainage metagenome]|uniref:Uncharacterized protein n=1 Tax=mine drainage metagenome TaxID=410659 RepID=A0A1J5TG36_9ZZZZ
MATIPKKGCAVFVLPVKLLNQVRERICYRH